MELIQPIREGNNLPHSFDINVTVQEIEFLTLGLECYVNQINNTKNSSAEEKETARICWNLRQQLADIHNFNDQPLPDNLV